MSDNTLKLDLVLYKPVTDLVEYTLADLSSDRPVDLTVTEQGLSPRYVLDATEELLDELNILDHVPFALVPPPRDSEGTHVLNAGWVKFDMDGFLIEHEIDPENGSYEFVGKDRDFDKILFSESIGQLDTDGSGASPSCEK